MKQGRPLTDEDRAPWLEELSKLITGPAESTRSAVIACSALKQRYRKRPGESGADVRYFYLKGRYDLIHGRLTERQAHFLKADLLESQFEILEEPGEAVTIDVSEDPARIVKRIRQALGL